ncbi:hypothetical protein AURDEDRAFT_121918 [Auricularia subglabra TFB-10046 SS5]|nr:hypothetical protein AURDEDRAFT_121918 [Auricularia subglabra TFB-10046 SS5]
MLCAHVVPHLHRLRALTLRSRRRSNYIPVFTLLQREAPVLCYLDVSHDRSEYVVFESAMMPLSDAFALAPKLSSINWGGHALPIVPNRLFAVTSLSLSAPSPAVKTRLFLLFPSLECLRLDNFSSTHGFPKLPADHPLVRLELCARPIEKLPYTLNWPYLMSLGFGRLVLLHLRSGYSASLVIKVCLDPDWELKSVTTDYDDFVDASFLRCDSRSESRMSAMRPSRGTTWSMRRLMVETDWLRGLAVARAVGAPEAAVPAAPARPSTRGLFGDGHVEAWGTLFDADILDDCGVLEAPHLRVIRLLARARTPQHTSGDAIISPAEAGDRTPAHSCCTERRCSAKRSKSCVRRASRPSHRSGSFDGIESLFAYMLVHPVAMAHITAVFESDASSARKLGPHALPEELITAIAELLDWQKLVRMARVCHAWRYAIFHCAALWTRLDLYDIGNRALVALPELLPLSGNRPFDLRVRIINENTRNNVNELCLLLQPQLHRLRALTLRSRRWSNLAPVFSLLLRPAPSLLHLDVALDSRDHGTSRPYDVTFASVPNLRSVNWGSLDLPESPSRLFDATTLRIFVTPFITAQVFSLFSRATTLCLDGFRTTSGVQTFPPEHPLESLELRVHPDGNYDFSLQDLLQLGLGRIMSLHLRCYTTAMLISACQDPEWQLNSLTIEYDEELQASLTRRNSDSVCRMTGLTSSHATQSARRLLNETAWLSGLASLTLSAARPYLLLPRGSLPALREFSLLCGTPSHWTTQARSLFDSDTLNVRGTLDAPHLRVVRLLARTNNANAVVPPGSLARFISGHVRVAGDRVPLLKISLSLRFADDADGMAALRAAVDTIEDWLD